MSASPPILYIDDIHLTHGVTPLLDGAALSVGRDDRICLVGRNGSGKSTLLKIIAGLIEPDSGERFVQPGTAIEYLAQDPDFTGFTSAEDFVLQGFFNNEDRQRAFQLMADLHIAPKAELAPMSGGERRRVALAKAMALQPEILLLDEPTNHLDLPAIEWLETALRQINSALILVSHDRRFLSNMASQTVWLDRGRTKLMRKGFGHFEDWRDAELTARRNSSISWRAKLPAKRIGCAMGCRRGASAMSNGWAICMRCANKGAIIAGRKAIWVGRVAGR